MTRKPLREKYDAFVALAPGQSIPEFAFGLVKLTYNIKGGVAVLTEPEPLLHDVWGPVPLEPRFPVGSDFWFQKIGADVVVRGSAYNPGGSPIETARVSVSIGKRTKQIAVFGHRVVLLAEGRYARVFQARARTIRAAGISARLWRRRRTGPHSG